MPQDIELSAFSLKGYDKGAGIVKRTLWYFVNALFVRASWNPFMAPKIWLLRMFGAKIGHGLVLKNEVRIKSPWRLTIGNDCWIGEKVWIDNLDEVIIGSNACLSQEAFLLTGDHDYTSSTMAYRNAPIRIEDGAWIAARATVCAGVTVHRNAVLTVASMTAHDLEANGIYKGVPAMKVRERVIDKD